MPALTRYILKAFKRPTQKQIECMTVDLMFAVLNGLHELGTGFTTNTSFILYVGRSFKTTLLKYLAIL